MARVTENSQVDKDARKLALQPKKMLPGRFLRAASPRPHAPLGLLLEYNASQSNAIALKLGLFCKEILAVKV